MGADAVADATPVTVLARVRPVLDGEDGGVLHVEAASPSQGAPSAKRQRVGTVLRLESPFGGQDIRHSFDTVFGPSSTQEEVFRSSVEPALSCCVQGHNLTVFAYGATGAGKTFTMQGGQGSSQGVIPRTVNWLLHEAPKRADGEVSLEASYLEIYNNKVYDLLKPQKGDLALRETAEKGSVVIANLHSERFASAEAFDELYECGCRNRRMAATQLNEHSSRSHAVVLIRVSVLLSNGKTLVSKVHLIDLAGSEDNRKTGNHGERLRESGSINTSLLVLGKVISALNGSNSGLVRVPYRDSKLTRLLQDSLGGSAKALMILNVAPRRDMYQDTNSALNFASKARHVVNRVKTNVSSDERAEAPRMEDRLAEWRRRRKSVAVGSASVASIAPSTPASRTATLKRASSEASMSPATRNDMALSYARRALTAVNHGDESRARDMEARATRVGVTKEEWQRAQSTAAKENVPAPMLSPETRTKALKNLMADHMQSVSGAVLAAVNERDLSGLCSLREIGKRRAEAILEARRERGRFTSLEDLANAGLGSKLVERIVRANALDVVQHTA